MEENNNAWIITAIVVGVILIFVGMLVLYHPTSIKPETTFDLNPSSLDKKSATEPVVDNWTTYSNDKYNFSINVPADWKIQEYTPTQPNGGLLVAFSPNGLPCGTCTYFRNGFYSVRLYNQTSDPDYFKDFQARIAKSGKSKDYIPVKFGKYNGVINLNTIAVDHGDWVYEISLDEDNGTKKVSDSKLFQKAVSTFAFTGLLFGN